MRASRPSGSDATKLSDEGPDGDPLYVWPGYALVRPGRCDVRYSTYFVGCQEQSAKVHIWSWTPHVPVRKADAFHSMFRSSARLPRVVVDCQARTTCVG